ncbi:hypothetical protein [Pseudonocardia sp. NPDC049154]|uniref:hypothetical protein n=1 Tax=Pseudonocardia sp. NPDC049154 TaxID=3155501 RepID=UPI0034116D5A
MSRVDTSSDQGVLVFTRDPLPARDAYGRYGTLALQPTANRRFEGVVRGERPASRPTFAGLARLGEWGATVPAAVRGAAPRLALDVVRTVVQDRSVGASTGRAVARIGLMRRAAGMSSARFREHYLSHHAPLVMRRGPLFFRYSIHLVRDPEASGWDAVVEQWFVDDATWREHDRLVLEEKEDVRADMAEFVGTLVSFAGRTP